MYRIFQWSIYPLFWLTFTAYLWQYLDHIYYYPTCWLWPCRTKISFLLIRTLAGHLGGTILEFIEPSKEGISIAHSPIIYHFNLAFIYRCSHDPYVFPRSAGNRRKKRTFKSSLREQSLESFWVWARSCRYEVKDEISVERHLLLSKTGISIVVAQEGTRNTPMTRYSPFNEALFASVYRNKIPSCQWRHRSRKIHEAVVHPLSPGKVRRIFFVQRWCLQWNRKMQSKNLQR